jgi:hypothetical protein
MMKDVCAMKEVDEQDLKAEIDEISKKIDTIIQNIESMDPAKDESEPTAE